MLGNFLFFRIIKEFFILLILKVAHQKPSIEKMKFLT